MGFVRPRSSGEFTNLTDEFTSCNDVKCKGGHDPAGGSSTLWLSDSTLCCYVCPVVVPGNALVA